MARIRFALRNLARSPLLSLVVVVSLGLGIGANTAIFSLMRQMVLSALPVPHPEELALLKAPGVFKGGRNSTGNAGGMDFIFSYPIFRGLEKNPAGFQGVAAFRDLAANIAYGSQTVHGRLMVVSGDYFRLLGVTPVMGRMITPSDDATGSASPAVVLSYGFWRDKMGGQMDVLNQPVRINGNAFTIVGVAPQDFTGLTLGIQAEVYVPLAFKAELTPGWDGTKRFDDFWLYLFGRRKPGTTMAQAEAAINTTYPQLRDQQASALKYGPTTAARFQQSKITLADGAKGQSSMRDDARTPLLILIGATAMVLLIAVANAANLLLARSAQRRREMAIRAAIGASRTELMAEMLTEAMLLALGGAAAGVAIGVATLRFLIYAYAGGDRPVYFLNTTLDWQTLAYSIGLALVTGLLAGLYPAWQASRTELSATMQADSGRSSASRGTSLARTSLVCAQVAISAALLIPTGLFLKSLVNLMRVDLGMRTESLAQFSVSPELNGYKFAECSALFERMETDLRAIPGVQSVAAAMVPLVGGSNWGNDVDLEGQPKRDDAHANYNEIGAGYFGKLGVPLLGGREFTNADNLAAPRVAIVNEEFVRKFYDGKGALGHRFVADGASVEIVGVVKNSAYSSVKRKPYPIYYVPWRQDKEVGDLSFYVRSGLPMDQMMPQIRRVIHNIDGALPLEGLRTLDQQVAESVQSDRLILELSGAFAALATLLAMLGLYGVMAFSVTRRTREIGIRMALGARPGTIHALVMRQMLVILAIGLAIGVPAAVEICGVTKSQLFGVKAFDWPTMAGAIVALAVAAIAAGWLPAQRAAGVDPAGVLRAD